MKCPFKSFGEFGDPLDSKPYFAFTQQLLNLKHDVYAFTATSTSAVQPAGPATTGVESSPLSTVDVQLSAASGRQSAASAAVTVPRAADGIQSTVVAAKAGQLCVYCLRCLNVCLPAVK